MINMRQMLNEDRSASADKGCLMAMLSEEDSNNILKFTKQLINEGDLYIEGNEFGIEKESHATIRYGFTKDLNELQIRQLLKGQKQFLVEIKKLNTFDTNPLFDVVKFEVDSPVLRKLNEESKKYPNENAYPQYNPHITLCYVKKGTFPHQKELQLYVPIRSVCYSPIQGGKSYFDLC
jgi:hypothetical protein